MWLLCEEGENALGKLKCFARLCKFSNVTPPSFAGPILACFREDKVAPLQRGRLLFFFFYESRLFLHVSSSTLEWLLTKLFRDNLVCEEGLPALRSVLYARVAPVSSWFPCPLLPPPLCGPRCQSSDCVCYETLTRTETLKLLYSYCWFVSFKLSVSTSTYPSLALSDVFW